MDGCAFLWGSFEDDIEQLQLAYHEWLLAHREDMGSLGPKLVLNDETLVNAYDQDIFPALNCFPRSANACKRGAIIMFALAFHRPLECRLKKHRELSNAESRLLRLINAKAAFEIAEAYAREMPHGDDTKGDRWSFVNRAKFPSLHSYVDFMAGIANISLLNFDRDCEVTVEFIITRLSITLELCFYRCNADIAGKTDGDFWKTILNAPGFLEYGFLNLDRNADDVCGLPSQFKRDLCRRQKAD